MSTPMTIEQRFSSRVEVNDETGCHEWSGGKDGYGKYGLLTIGKWGSEHISRSRPANGRKCVAHRVAWEIYKGPIPAGMLVCHSCDNTLCVNPDHLFLGTQKENMMDMDSKGRRVVRGRPSHCPRGHKYSDENLYRQDGKGSGTCLTCRRERWSEWRESPNARGIKPAPGRPVMSINEKIEVAAKYRCGFKVQDLAVEYGVSPSTIYASIREFKTS